MRGNSRIYDAKVIPRLMWLLILIFVPMGLLKKRWWWPLVIVSVLPVVGLLGELAIYGYLEDRVLPFVRLSYYLLALLLAYLAYGLGRLIAFWAERRAA